MRPTIKPVCKQLAQKRTCHEALDRQTGLSCFGSYRLGFFDDGGDAQFRVLPRTLAMDLHGWLLRTIRKELQAKPRLTVADIGLLEHQQAGHSSKVIGAALNMEAKTGDCRLQRVSTKLEASDRRTAVRIARLYDLLKAGKTKPD